MHRSRLVILIGAAVAALSLPLPLVSLGAAGSVNGVDGDGWPGVVILMIVAVVALLGDRGESLTAAGTLVAMAGSGVAVVFSVVKLADAADAIDLIGEGSFGIGLWLLMASGVVAFVGAALSLSRRLG